MIAGAGFVSLPEYLLTENDNLIDNYPTIRWENKYCVDC